MPYALTWRRRTILPRLCRNSLAPAAGACPVCDGTGLTEQNTTRSRRKIRGQLGICLACLGTGNTPDPQPHHV